MTEKLDGRHLRKERTRQNICEAARHVLMSYALHNGPFPRVTDIVRLAGVSTRTFFDHFPCTSDVILAALTKEEVADMATAMRNLSDASLVAAACRWTHTKNAPHYLEPAFRSTRVGERFGHVDAGNTTSAEEPYGP